MGVGAGERHRNKLFFVQEGGKGTEPYQAPIPIASALDTQIVAYHLRGK